MANLTPKQQRFVDEYLVDLNGSAAAIRAGYGEAGSRVAAHRLLTNANVRASIEAKQALDSQALQIERQDAIKGLLEAVEQARVLGDPGAMISGWTAIGRMLGFFASDRVSVVVASAAVGAEVARLEELSDAELSKLAGLGAM